MYHFFLQDSSDGSFYTLAFKELFPLDEEFASKNVEPEKHEAYKSYQQALGKLTDDVISNAIKLKVDTKEKDLNVKIAKTTLYLSSTPWSKWVLFNEQGS